MNSLLDNILNVGRGTICCRFANADGKVWIMPVRNMRTAMNLYQPSGRNGKLVKALLPWLAWCRLVRHFIRAERISYVLRPDLHKLLVEVLGVDDFEFSVFGGTPSVHQKITMQLCRENCILGYCKLSDSEDIITLFHREAKLLKQLSRQKLTDCVPQVLFCGELSDGIGVFVQNTVKTNRSKVVHEWSSLQDKFLFRLQQATKQRLFFEESDYYRTLAELQTHLEWLPEQIDRQVITTIIEKVCTKYRGKEMEFSAYHADFTPWNMFVEKGKLFVFDWEYAQLTYPHGLDRYHFFTQTAFFEKHWTSSQIIDYMQSDQGKWMDRESFSLYLLDVMSRFTVREKGNVKGDVARSFQLWTDLLQSINQ